MLEFKTLVDHITCAINNRPLGIVQDNLQPLTPNHLLMGRNFSPIAPITPAAGDTSALGLSLHQKDLYKLWWSRWRAEVLPKLFTPGSKWSDSHPNVQVGDICLLLSHKGSAGKMLTFYKYCKVIKTILSDDNLVRKVVIEYHIPYFKKKQVFLDVRRKSERQFQ